MMVLETLDRPNDPTPLYYRLASILRGAIEAREYCVGDSLPPNASSKTFMV